MEAEGRAKAYRFRGYLRSRVLVLAGAACSMCIMAFLLAVLRLGAPAIIIVIVLTAFPLSCVTVAEYLRRRRFYQALSRSSARSETAAYIASNIERPSGVEERISWDALTAQESALSAKMGEATQELEAYREYIELWIHEVKTPIAAIRLMLASEYGELAGRLSSEVDRIEQQVEAALYYARSTSLAEDYAIREVVLADTVRAVCKKHARYLINLGAAPEVAVSQEVTVLADHAWLEFIIAQITINAAKYGAHHIRFSTREHEAGEGVEDEMAATILEIADDGCGIPAADMPYLFERGFTGQNGRAHAASTGMGLYLVSELCRKMGLGIAAASEEGAGSRFMLSFPHDRSRLRAYLAKP